MTKGELEILEKLGEIWNLFLALPIEHPMARSEFCTGVHTLQNHVAARPAIREIRGILEEQGED